jgi:hypothetical protein
MTNTAYEPSQDLYQNPRKLGVTTGWFDPLIGEALPVLFSQTRASCSSNPRLHHHGSS